jgi:hypothetical protein
MKTSTRRILGATVLGVSLAVALVLYFSGTPLLSLGQWHTSSFTGESVTCGSVDIHWPCVAVCIPGLLGLAALLWPQPKPPRLPV